MPAATNLLAANVVIIYRSIFTVPSNHDFGMYLTRNCVIVAYSNEKGPITEARLLHIPDLIVTDLIVIY